MEQLEGRGSCLVDEYRCHEQVRSSGMKEEKRPQPFNGPKKNIK